MAVQECSLFQARAAGVEVEVLFGAVVDEPVRVLAAGVADCVLDGGRGLDEELEGEVEEERMDQLLMLNWSTHKR